MVYRPQANGHVERLNRTILNAIKRVIVQPGDVTDEYRKDWSDYLNAVVFAYNTTRQRTTGFTPFYLVYGREARLPAHLLTTPQSITTDDETYTTAIILRALAIQKLRDLDDHIVVQIDNRQKKYTATYNQRLSKLPDSEVIRVGDLVLRRRQEVLSRAESKLKAQWLGPYRVLHIATNGAVHLADLDGVPLPRPRHRDHLVRYYDQNHADVVQPQRGGVARQRRPASREPDI
jgi:hypothetical protein